MNKHQNKKGKGQIIFIVLVLISAFLLITNFIPIFIINAGLTTEFTGAFYSGYSTYVNQSDPNMNYDDFQYSRFIGNSCETYLHYSFSLLPNETERLYLYLSYYGFYDTDWIYSPPVEDVEINIISIEEGWNVSEITWNNKPEHGEIINTVNISNIYQGFVMERYDLQKATDITEFYQNNKFEEVSLCINITNNNKELNNTSVYLSPHLLWNYEKIILSYTNIISTSIIISMLIVTIWFLRREIYTCPNCGAKRVHKEVSCFKCEKTFEVDQITKRSDHQLILIFLLVFILLEGSYLIVTILFYIFFFSFVYFIPFTLIPWLVLCLILLKIKIKHYKKVKI